VRVPAGRPRGPGPPLRDLEDAAQTYPGAAWPAAISAALRGPDLRGPRRPRRRAARRPRCHRRPLATAYRDGVTTGLAQIAAMPRGTSGHHRQPCRQRLEDLRDREHDILRFTTDLRIPPTSNQAERDLRPAKTQDKISGRAPKP
jgi:hypothetical protein